MPPEFVNKAGASGFTDPSIWTVTGWHHQNRYDDETIIAWVSGKNNGEHRFAVMQLHLDDTVTQHTTVLAWREYVSEYATAGGGPQGYNYGYWEWADGPWVIYHEDGSRDERDGIYLYRVILDANGDMTMSPVLANRAPWKLMDEPYERWGRMSWHEDIDTVLAMNLGWTAKIMQAEVGAGDPVVRVSGDLGPSTYIEYVGESARVGRNLVVPVIGQDIDIVATALPGQTPVGAMVSLPNPPAWPYPAQIHAHVKPIDDRRFLSIRSDPYNGNHTVYVWIGTITDGLAGGIPSVAWSSRIDIPMDPDWTFFWVVLGAAVKGETAWVMTTHEHSVDYAWRFFSHPIDLTTATAGESVWQDKPSEYPPSDSTTMDFLAPVWVNFVESFSPTRLVYGALEQGWESNGVYYGKAYWHGLLKLGGYVPPSINARPGSPQARFERIGRHHQ